MSSLSFRDLIGGSYKVVSIDGEELKVSSSKDTDKAPIVLNGIQSSKVSDKSINRFGLPIETIEEKATRGYLLANEVSGGSVIARVGAKGKGKGKGKRNKSKGKGGEVTKAYTNANPPPAAMNYIASNKDYRFSQQVPEVTILTTSTTLATFAATSFKLSDLDQVSSFQAVFDQYIIDEVEVWIENVDAHLTSQNAGNLYSVIDYDDANVLSTTASACDYTNVLGTSADASHYRKFRPHVAVAAYSGAFTSFANMESQWIDMASPAVQHYGLKLACTATTGVQSFVARYRYHIRMRNTR